MEVNASGFSKEIQELDAMLDEINNEKNNDETNNADEDDDSDNEQTHELYEEEKSDQACSINKKTEKENKKRDDSLNE